MKETISKRVIMTLDEFKKYEVPKGWVMKFCEGCLQYPGYGLSAMTPVFEMRVTIEEINNGIF
jgi:hypothetical protein